MYTSYGKLYNFCGNKNLVKINSQKFVEPNFNSYLESANNNIKTNDFENDLFIYGRKEHLSGYRYNPLYEREHQGIKQLKYIKGPVYDETTETEGCRTCSTKSIRENYTCTKNTCGLNGEKIDPLMDPRYNLRECSKHLILLEDHLFHKEKRCKDCILKHCLMIEGLLDEGITLDKNREYDIHTSLNLFRNVFKNLSKNLKDNNLNDSDCSNYAQELREIRKPLCQTYGTFIE